MKDKERYAHLLMLADDAVCCVLQPQAHDFKIDSQYNGHVAAFGVSIVMSGVMPTLAYFNNSTNETQTVLRLFSKMVVADGFPVPDEDFSTAENLYATAARMSYDRLDNFRREILECSVALKQVIRTYKLV